MEQLQPPDHPYPRIALLPAGVPRPLWTVIIPVCNRTRYLAKAVASVLSQSPPPDKMQICIVDNSNNALSWETLLSPEALTRIEFIRQPQQLSPAANWTNSIRHARGHLIHILHDDDWVLPGFYGLIESLVAAHPSAGFYATRCLLVDAAGHATGITPFVPGLTEATHDPSEFLYECRLQCPGIVVRRSAYELVGGFSNKLTYVIDVDMWIRVIHACGGVATPELGACYRVHDDNISQSMQRAARHLVEYDEIIDTLAGWDPKLPAAWAKRRLLRDAEHAERRYRTQGEHDIAKSYRDYWEARATARDRLRRLAWDTTALLYSGAQWVRLFD